MKMTFEHNKEKNLLIKIVRCVRQYWKKKKENCVHFHAEMCISSYWMVKIHSSALNKKYSHHVRGWSDILSVSFLAYDVCNCFPLVQVFRHICIDTEQLVNIIVSNEARHISYIRRKLLTLAVCVCVCDVRRRWTSYLTIGLCSWCHFFLYR